jgi:hypothetical protein
LPRDLGDVIHYLLPQRDGDDRPSNGPGDPRFAGRFFHGPPVAPDRPAALPIIALPIGERDVVRAAYAWNLAVEVARQGASSTLVAPASSEPAPLWPEPGRGPVGAELVLSDARSFGELSRAALDVAVNRAADSNDGGAVFVTVPPPWFGSTRDGRALMRWVLLFAAAESRDLLEAYSLAKRIIAANAEARVGVTIHGVRRVGEAESAFLQLADVAVRHLAHPLTSYGLLVDDLHVYRAIVSRRPIGLEHPQSRAARALRDVARLLLDDARMQAIA